MMGRCYNPVYPSFRSYGGKHVGVCRRWHSFVKFFEDMGRRPLNQTLDRRNPYGNYEKRNCRWATPKQQRANQRATC